jgi:alcohol dehydrogenase class IV
MNFKFIIPKRIIFGWDSLNEIREELKKVSGNKLLIVTSRGMMKRDSFIKAINFIREGNWLPIIFNDVEPEPSIETAELCLEMAKENGCELVIGLGGGSVMDVAKKVAMDLNVPKIMIPTTAGTGSEVTHESVLKVKGKKKAFVDERLTADVAIVDPSLMMTMPRRLIASSGIDALAHSIESYSCKKGNELTRTLAYKAYLLIKDNLRKAILYDENAMSNMALASMIAGMAFGNSGTTLCHALSYPLSNIGIPHGIAVAMTLLPSLQFNEFDGRIISEIRELIKDVGLPVSLPTSLNESDIYEMAKLVMEDERHLTNNPKSVTFNDVITIYKSIMDRC